MISIIGSFCFSIWLVRFLRLVLEVSYFGTSSFNAWNFFETASLLCLVGGSWWQMVAIRERFQRIATCGNRLIHNCFSLVWWQDGNSFYKKNSVSIYITTKGLIFKRSSLFKISPFVVLSTCHLVADALTLVQFHLDDSHAMPQWDTYFLGAIPIGLRDEFTIDSVEHDSCDALVG